MDRLSQLQSDIDRLTEELHEMEEAQARGNLNQREIEDVEKLRASITKMQQEKRNIEIENIYQNDQMVRTLLNDQKSLEEELAETEKEYSQRLSNVQRSGLMYDAELDRIGSKRSALQDDLRKLQSELSSRRNELEATYGRDFVAELQADYENKRPITFHHDDGEEEIISPDEQVYDDAYNLELARLKGEDVRGSLANTSEPIETNNDSQSHLEQLSDEEIYKNNEWIVSHLGEQKALEEELAELEREYNQRLLNVQRSGLMYDAELDNLGNRKATLEDRLKKLQEEIENRKAEVEANNPLVKLQADYKNKRPITFHHDDGEEEIISPDEHVYDNAYNLELARLKGEKIDQSDEWIVSHLDKHKTYENEQADVQTNDHLDKNKTYENEQVGVQTNDHLDKVKANYEKVVTSHHDEEEEVVSPDENSADLVDEASEQQRSEETSTPSNLDLSDNQQNGIISEPNYVVMRNGNFISIIGRISSADLPNLDSEIHKKYKGKKGYTVKLYDTRKILPNTNYRTVDNILFSFDDAGIITIKGRADEIEFHNQLEMIEVVKKRPHMVNGIDVNQVLEFARTEQTDRIMQLIEEKGYYTVRDAMYDAFFDRLEAGEKSSEVSNYYKFIDIVNSIYDEYGGLKENADNNSMAIVGPISSNSESKAIVGPISSNSDSLTFAEPVSSNNDTVASASSNNDTVASASSNSNTVSDSKVSPFIPATAKIGRTKNPKPSFLKKARQMFSSLKGWQKVVIIGGAIAIIGIGAYHLVPMAANAINNLINSGTDSNTIANASPEALSRIGQSIKEGANHILKSASQSIGNVSVNVPGEMTEGITNVTSAASVSPGVIDWSNIGPGSSVARDAYSAVSHSGMMTANSWFGNNPLDVFNTATHEFLHLSPEQLKNLDFMQTLANDPNNAILFGNSLQEPSGYMSLADAFSQVAKGGMHL